jgi:hypothetical protein
LTAIVPATARQRAIDLARLERYVGVERPLTAPEYVFSSIGITGQALAPAFVVFVLEGEGPDFDQDFWRGALERVSAVNPGCRLRLVDRLGRARWAKDGKPPRLRFVERTDWDGMSGAGSEFIYDAVISLENGPCTEIILVNESPRGRLVILRTSHAVMDGRGALHFMAEIFRALRGEALLGSNAGLAGVDIKRTLTCSRPDEPKIETDWLTGPPQGSDRGFEWRRIGFRANGRNLLARLAEVLARYMHGHSALPALFTIPVDLRRHLPGLLATTNCTGQLRVALDKGEDAADFRRKLDTMLQARMEAYPRRGAWIVGLLPRRLIDRLTMRAVLRTKRPFQTAVISTLGRIDPDEYSFDGFRLRSCIPVPFPGVTLVAVVSVRDRLDLVVTMPKMFSSNGRLDDLLDHLQASLSDRD